MNNKSRKLARMCKRSERAAWVPLIGRAYGPNLHWSSAVSQYVFGVSRGWSKRATARALRRCGR